MVKFQPNIIGFDTLVDCDCEATHGLNEGENKGFDSKRVAENCFCQITDQSKQRKDRPITKVSRVFVNMKPELFTKALKSGEFKKRS